jgi:hypothetical protein
MEREGGGGGEEGEEGSFWMPRALRCGGGGNVGADARPRWSGPGRSVAGYAIRDLSHTFTALGYE